VELGEKLEAVVNDLVKNGRYNSKSEMLREGVRLVQEREAALRRLDEALQRGLIRPKRCSPNCMRNFGRPNARCG
jgi:putative addiction module CopG family antidote